jgi:hypothetical protein
MSALIGKEIPFGFPSWDFCFTEPHQFVCKKGEISRVLMASALVRFGSWILIPLFAGDLTSPASRTLGCIYEKGFICHLSHLL